MNDFPYGDKVLEFITNLDTERCLFDFETASIPEVLDKNDEKEIADIIVKIKKEFDVDDDTAEEYLYAWGIWAKDKWSFPCEACGAMIEVSRFTSGHGCICGTKYHFPEWGEYVLTEPGNFEELQNLEAIKQCREVSDKYFIETFINSPWKVDKSWCEYEAEADEILESIDVKKDFYEKILKHLYDEQGWDKDDWSIRW